MSGMSGMGGHAAGTATTKTAEAGAMEPHAGPGHKPDSDLSEGGVAPVTTASGSSWSTEASLPQGGKSSEPGRVPGCCGHPGSLAVANIDALTADFVCRVRLVVEDVLGSAMRPVEQALQEIRTMAQERQTEPHSAFGQRSSNGSINSDLDQRGTGSKKGKSQSHHSGVRWRKRHRRSPSTASLPSNPGVRDKEILAQSDLEAAMHTLCGDALRICDTGNDQGQDAKTQMLISSTRSSKSEAAECSAQQYARQVSDSTNKSPKPPARMGSASRCARQVSGSTNRSLKLPSSAQRSARQVSTSKVVNDDQSCSGSEWRSFDTFNSAASPAMSGSACSPGDWTSRLGRTRKPPRASVANGQFTKVRRRSSVSTLAAGNPQKHLPDVHSLMLGTAEMTLKGYGVMDQLTSYGNGLERLTSGQCSQHPAGWSAEEILSNVANNEMQDEQLSISDEELQVVAATETNRTSSFWSQIKFPSLTYAKSVESSPDVTSPAIILRARSEKLTSVIPADDAQEVQPEEALGSPSIRIAMKICGVFPWKHTESGFLRSRVLLYQWFVLLLALAAGASAWWAKYANNKKCSEFDTVYCHSADLLMDVPLIAGSILGLLAVHAHVGSREIQTCTRIVLSYCNMVGITSRWMKSVQMELMRSVAVWCITLAVRFVAEGATVHAFACAISSTVLMSLIFAMCLFCQGLYIMLDHYCIQVATDQEIDVILTDWGIVHSLLTMASDALGKCVFVLQLAAMLAVVLGVVDIVQGADTRAQTGSLVAWSFVIVALGRTMLCAAGVTDRCGKAPSLITSLSRPIEDDKQDLVQHIIHSDAGFYILQVKLNSQLAFKLVYLTCAIGFATATRFADRL